MKSALQLGVACTNPEQGTKNKEEPCTVGSANGDGSGWSLLQPDPGTEPVKAALLGKQLKTLQETEQKSGHMTWMTENINRHIYCSLTDIIIKLNFM